MISFLLAARPVALAKVDLAAGATVVVGGSTVAKH